MIDMYSGDKTFVLFAVENLCNMAVNPLSHDSSHKYNRAIDIFWKHLLSFKQATTYWQGIMHLLHKENEQPGQTSVMKLLPMIDMYSGNKT